MYECTIEEENDPVRFTHMICISHVLLRSSSPGLFEISVKYLGGTMCAPCGTLFDRYGVHSRHSKKRLRIS